MSVMCPKENKAVANGGYKSVSFMINDSVKVVLCLLGIFFFAICPNVTLNFPISSILFHIF